MTITKKSFKIHIFLFVALSLLFVGITSTSPAVANHGGSHSNNGMPTRVQNGEFGNRINLVFCIFGTCADIGVSASDSNYVFHGWSEIPGLTMGQGQPLTFQLFIDGDEVKLQRFGLGGGSKNGNRYFFYTVFEPGSLDVGTHSITGVWTAKNAGPFVGATNLVVSA